MIRIWKGIEKEGIGADSEVMTLFVCTTTAVPGKLVLGILIDNADIKAIYFGAGRREFYGMTAKEWDKLILYCEAHDIKITIEVSPMMLETFIHIYNNKQVTFVVSYYNVPKNINRLFFKTDDYAVTRIFTANKEVDITEVVDDRYPNDVVIYEEVEE